MSKHYLLYRNAILFIVWGQLYVDCSLYLLTKDVYLTEDNLYTSLVSVVSKITCAKFCSEDASCGTATYNVTSRTCSFSSIISVHDGIRNYLPSASGMYVMSRFLYPGKTELEQPFRSYYCCCCCCCFCCWCCCCCGCCWFCWRLQNSVQFLTNYFWTVKFECLVLFQSYTCRSKTALTTCFRWRRHSRRARHEEWRWRHVMTCCCHVPSVWTYAAADGSPMTQKDLLSALSIRPVDLQLMMWSTRAMMLILE